MSTHLSLTVKGGALEIQRQCSKPTNHNYERHIPILRNRREELQVDTTVVQCGETLHIIKV